MTTIIAVRFKSNGKQYYFDPQGLTVRTGDSVIVETARGLELGEAVRGNTEVADNTVVQPLKHAVRVATEADHATVRRNLKRADEAFIICKDKIVHHKLEMNLVTVECTFDMSKMLFYFTADGRVDFRELVKDLASVFRTRIELRQIGVRDEAKMIGGLGTCGRELCCSSYLEDFHPVSINMAKEQNLSLNPTKISGTCGRLMCCLKYEHEAYAELQKVTPKNGAIVDTPDGRGRVVSTQMLRGLCKVQLDDAADHTLQTFPCGECCAVRGAAGKGGCGKCCGQTAPKDENAAPKPERAAKFERAPRPPRTEQDAVVQQSAEPQDALQDTDEQQASRRRRRGGRRRPGKRPADAPQDVSGEE